MMLFIAFSGSMAALISSDPIGRTQYSVIAGGKKWNGKKINGEKRNGEKRNGEKINGKEKGWSEQLKRIKSSEKVRD